MGVEVDQFGVLRLWVQDSEEIQRVRFLAARAPDGLVKVKHPLEAVEVLWLDAVEAQTDGNAYEDALALIDFLLNFVEEHVAIVAHHHAEAG